MWVAAEEFLVGDGGKIGGGRRHGLFEVLTDELLLQSVNIRLNLKCATHHFHKSTLWGIVLRIHRSQSSPFFFLFSVKWNTVIVNV